MMASISYTEHKRIYRVFYRLKINGGFVDKAKYAKQKSKANGLKTQLEQLESATRTGIATLGEIEQWIARGWLKKNEATQGFPGYEESMTRKKRTQVSGTNYKEIQVAYEEYVQANSKGGIDRKSYRNHISMANQVLAWLEEEFPNISRLNEGAISHRLRILKEAGGRNSRGYSEWTLCHYLTKLRLLLDQAVKLGMVHDNPARQITVGQPKKSTTRRVLSEDEAKHLLKLSLHYGSRLGRTLPTVVRLGLYAGLRNEEMCWLKWDAVDWKNRILAVRESLCEITGTVWKPKDYEARRIDVKESCIEFLKNESNRQAKEGFKGPFVLSGRQRWEKRQQDKPFSPNEPQKIFRKMIQAEDLDAGITVYTLRHTFATMALRAGVDLRTLQQRMGHSDIKTTMEYLHFIEPEQHPLDKLPY